MCDLYVCTSSFSLRFVMFSSTWQITQKDAYLYEIIRVKHGYAWANTGPSISELKPA
jgi:hypothetical protein